MLPNLRLVIAGCLASFVALMGAMSAVFLPAQETRTHVTTARLSQARGPMIDTATHPEWKPFIVRAAMLRADEVTRLLDLPGQRDAIVMPVSLPREPADAAPEEITNATVEIPDPTIDVEIGASSSTELPVISPPETAPAVAKPNRAKTSARPDKKPRNARRATISRAAKPSVSASNTAGTLPNPFGNLFSGN